MSFSDLIQFKFRESDEPDFNEKISGARFFNPHAVSPGYNLCSYLAD